MNVSLVKKLLLLVSVILYCECCLVIVDNHPIFEITKNEHVSKRMGQGNSSVSFKQEEERELEKQEDEEEQEEEFSNEALNYLEQINDGLRLLSLSTCLLSFLLLLMIYKTRVQRINIHYNLLICFTGKYFMDTLAITTGIESTEERSTVCNVVYLLEGFFNATTFVWMLNEGVYLFWKMHYVFRKDIPFRYFIATGYGLPFVLCICETLVFCLQFNFFKHCLESEHQDTWWPIILKILEVFLTFINIIVIVYLLQMVRSKLKTEYRTKTKRTFKVIQKWTALLTLVGGVQGLTIISMFIRNDKLEMSIDFFLSFEGFLLCVVHVFLSQNIRKEIRHRWRVFTANIWNSKVKHTHSKTIDIASTEKSRSIINSRSSHL